MNFEDTRTLVGLCKTPSSGVHLSNSNKRVIYIQKSATSRKVREKWVFQIYLNTHNNVNGGHQRLSLEIIGSTKN